MAGSNAANADSAGGRRNVRPDRSRSAVTSKAALLSRLGRLLVESGLIDEAQLADAERFQKERGGKIPHILVHLGHLKAKDLHQFLEQCGSMPSVDLAKFRTLPNPTELIPKDFAVQHQVFPIDKMGRLLTVASAIPLDDATIETLQQLTGSSVKAVLCNGDDIRKAINDHYPRRKRLPGRIIEEPKPSESEIRLGAIHQILQGISSLPTLSTTVKRVQDAVSRDDVGVAEVAAIIEHDPPVTANVLKLANSAAYGFRSEITDIYRAATLLGLHETEAIVISSAVITATEQSGHFNHKAYWDDATFGAFAARTISQAVGRRLDGAAFTAGLLHDIGRFALAETASQRYANVPRRLRGEELLNAENEHLGIAHPEAGYLLALQWDLPRDIAEAIRLHHHPVAASEASPLAGITALAAAMAEARHHGLNPLEVCGPVLQQLELPLSTGLQIYSSAVKTMQQHGHR